MRRPRPRRSSMTWLETKEGSKVIRCACGELECKIALWLEDEHRLWFRDKRGDEHFMYLPFQPEEVLLGLLKCPICGQDETGCPGIWSA